MRTFALSALLLAGCQTVGVASVRMPASGPVSSNVASLQTWGEDFISQHGALTSRASLASYSPEATCFDLLIRRPMPEGELRTKGLTYDVRVDVDGQPASRVHTKLPECPVTGAPCLPPDSSLQPYLPNTDERVLVEAQRICFEKMPRPTREVTLVADPGLGAWRFQFVLRPPAG